MCIIIEAGKTKAIPHKDCVRIAPSDFSSDCIEISQAYWRYVKEFLCKMTEKMQARHTQSR